MILKLIELGQSPKNAFKALIFIFASVVVIAIYQDYLDRQIILHGIYTKATVTNVEGRKGGLMITIKYQYDGKTFEGRLGSQMGKDKVGKQFYVRLMPSAPDRIILMENSPVPKCFTDKDAPIKGWKELPYCKR